MTNPLSFARSLAVILFEIKTENHFEHWTDYIIATRNNKGIYSVLSRRRYKLAEFDRFSYKTLTLNQNSNIKTAFEFVAAVMKCQDESRVQVDWDLLIVQLCLFDADFAKEVSLYVE
jgi:hypothetical protein